MRLENFLMIDAVDVLDHDGGKIVARADVPMESPVFEGHFPGYPLVPGVLLIETMAQAAGVLILPRLKFEQMPFLASITEAKLRTFVTAGETLDIEAEVELDGSGYTAVKARIKRDGKKVCNCSMLLRSLDWPNETFRTMVLGRYDELINAMAA